MLGSKMATPGDIASSLPQPSPSIPEYLQQYLNSHDNISSEEKEKLFSLHAGMLKYQSYIEDLCFDYPMTYHKLKQFVKRGNCLCDQTGKPISSTYFGDPTPGKNDPQFSRPCRCTEVGALCNCERNDGRCPCKINNEKCKPQQMKHIVRVYDINPRAITEDAGVDEFLQIFEYNVGQPNELVQLQIKLLDEGWEKLWNETQENDDDEFHEVFQSKGLPCRLITVNHLSSNVAKLLGAKYDIPADFFNRHLPGTEAISGRLISRLTSSVQIDFDEIYESIATFKSMWPDKDPSYGHKIILRAMESQFLYRNVGYDYFPVSFGDWWSSRDNSTLSNGFEILKQDDLMNVFQFNLTHRISVYANPPGHANTAIVIFYPRLWVCSDEDPLEPDPDVKIPRPKFLEEFPDVYFRAIPDTIPRASKIKEYEKLVREIKNSPHRCGKEDLPATDSSSSAKKSARKPSKKKKENSNMHTDRDTTGGHLMAYCKGIKQPFATAYDIEFQVHARQHFEARKKLLKERREQREKEQKEKEANQEFATEKQYESMKGKTVDCSGDTSCMQCSSDAIQQSRKSKYKAHMQEDHSNFIHLLGAPLFKMVAANWARLIVRRSFDLDLLEWRPKQRMDSRTIEEIKSRRVAITRHQKDISATLEILKSLVNEGREKKANEKYQELQADHRAFILAAQRTLSEGKVEYNAIRSNGLVGDPVEEDSWESIFGDFHELQASMDALDKRADKIQDGIVGLIKIWDAEHSGILNWIAIIFSLVVAPFTVVSSIYSSALTPDPENANPHLVPPRYPQTYSIAVVICFLAIGGFYSLLYVMKDSETQRNMIFWKWLEKFRRYRKRKREERSSPEERHIRGTQYEQMSEDQMNPSMVRRPTLDMFNSMRARHTRADRSDVEAGHG